MFRKSKFLYTKVLSYVTISAVISILDIKHPFLPPMQNLARAYHFDKESGSFLWSFPIQALKTKCSFYTSIFLSMFFNFESLNLCPVHRKDPKNDAESLQDLAKFCISREVKHCLVTLPQLNPSKPWYFYDFLFSFFLCVPNLNE